MKTGTPPFLQASVFTNFNTSISHGFFGRKGGVSRETFFSLNAGFGADDNPDHIAINRARISHAIGAHPEHLYSLHQHHSTDVIIIDQDKNPPWHQNFPWQDHVNPKADAMVTNIKGFACSALSADCAPVLFYDPVAQIVGAAHAGWRGALMGITDHTIAAMVSLGANPPHIRAAIGPCLGPRYFEVGPEFIDQFLVERSEAKQYFSPIKKGEKSLFDMNAYLRGKLERSGLIPHHIETLSVCTYAQPQDYFSYRFNCHHGISDYGRNLSTIMLV